MIGTIDWNPILLAFIAFLGTSVTALIGYLTIKLSKVAKVVDTTHILVNSQRGATLLTLAKTSEAKAAITHDPIDIGAANDAMKEYLSHMSQQAKVDAKPAVAPAAG